MSDLAKIALRAFVSSMVLLAVMLAVGFTAYLIFGRGIIE